MSFSAPQDYVQLPFTTDPTDLTDTAVAYYQSVWPDWLPDDGDPMTILIEGLAPMAANAAQIAANMPPAALIALGTKLIGVPYQVGVSASAMATFTVQDANGPYDIPEGAVVDIGGVAFATTADLTIPNGSTTGTVQIAATEPGADGNGFDGSDWASISLPVYVTNMVLAANTAGGVDQQDDNDYLNMLAQELQLRSRSLITLLDLEIAAVTTAGIGRAVAVASGSHPRDITVYVTDLNGQATTSAVKSTLSTQYAATRMVNAVITIADPTYTTVNVTYEVLSLPGVDPAGLRASINSKLESELSPAGWGAPTPSSGQSWVDQPVVHLNRLIGVISGVPGVDYVVSCSISASDVAQLSAPLSTGAAITSLPVAALKNAIPTGDSITITSGTNTQTWTTTSAAAVGATSIAVASQTPNFAYPSGSLISGPVSGDLTMPAGAGNLPQPGTMTGTIDTPTT